MEWAETTENVKILHKRQDGHTIYQVLSPSCSTTARQKSLSFNPKNIAKTFGEKNKHIGRMDHEQEEDNAEGPTELGTRTREEIGRGNQMAALGLQTGEGHQTPPENPRWRIKHTYRDYNNDACRGQFPS